MAGYVKLFASILDSTVWEQPPHIRVVWVTLLAKADQYGEVHSSVPGLARAALVERSECEEALAAFLAPDPDSRSKEFEGRRIEEIDGGWKILNHPKYRAMMTADERNAKRAEYMREYRKRNSHVTERNSMLPKVGHADQIQIRTDPKAEEEKKNVELRGTPEQRAVVKRVFEAWKHDTGHHRAMLDRKRGTRILARLREGATEEMLIRAITNRRNDPFLMGANDSGRVYDGIETLLRDAAQVERLERLSEPMRPMPSPNARNAGAALVRAARAATEASGPSPLGGLPGRTGQ